MGNKIPYLPAKFSSTLFDLIHSDYDEQKEFANDIRNMMNSDHARVFLAGMKFHLNIFDSFGAEREYYLTPNDLSLFVTKEFIYILVDDPYVDFNKSTKMSKLFIEWENYYNIHPSIGYLYTTIHDEYNRPIFVLWEEKDSVSNIKKVTKDFIVKKLEIETEEDKHEE